MTLPPGYSPKGELPPNAIVSSRNLSMALSKPLASNDTTTLEKLKLNLNNKFKLKDLRGLKHFLGIEIAKTKQGIFISQRYYVLQLLEDLGHLGCKPGNTPMEVNLNLSQDGEEKLADPKLYRRIIDKLQYLRITRPDLAYTVNKLS
ncbi:hypothetical protein CsatA_010219 [Cannabis sativa]